MPIHPSTRIALQGEFPTRPDQYLDYARCKSARVVAPQSLSRHLARPPRERIQRIYPLGVVRGVMMALREVAKQGLRLPGGLKTATGPTANAWARGVAAAAILPPKAAFDLSPPKAIRGVWHAGVERGILLVLQSTETRRKGGG